MTSSAHSVPAFAPVHEYADWYRSSVLVEQGARDTVLRANRAEGCRLDTLIWESS